MRKIYAVAILFALTIVSTGFKSPEEWVALKGDAYELAFPAKPKPSVQMVPSQIGELKMEINTYDASKSGNKDDNLVYMLISSDYPDSLINSGMKEKLAGFFRGAIDGGVKNAKGKLISETEIEIAGFPGRETKIDLNGGLAVIKSRCYLVKNRLYILQVIAMADKFPNESMNRFFDSFRLNTGS